MTLGVLLLGCVGFGAFKLSERRYVDSLPQLADDSTQTVAFGETMSLTYREIGRESNYIPWTGSVEVTLRQAKLYSSYIEANSSEDWLGGCSPNGLLHDEGDPFLVVGLEVRNADASQAGFSWDADAQSVPPGCVGLHSDSFLIDDRASSADSAARNSPACACVGGVDLSDYYESTLFTLAQGESLEVHLGFTLEDGAESSLPGACLEYRSPYDRLDLGL